MAYWLLKTEPSEWSWDDQVRAGVTAWTGVSNAQAQRNLKAMSPGDLALFYHTGDQKQVVGIVEVTRAAYPDASDATGKLVAVDVKAVEPLPSPVTLARIKGESKLAHLALVKQGRLSVSPVDDASWKRICTLGGHVK